MSLNLFQRNKLPPLSEIYGDQTENFVQTVLIENSTLETVWQEKNNYSLIWLNLAGPGHQITKLEILELVLIERHGRVPIFDEDVHTSLLNLVLRRIKDWLAENIIKLGLDHSKILHDQNLVSSNFDHFITALYLELTYQLVLSEYFQLIELPTQLQVLFEEYPLTSAQCQVGRKVGLVKYNWLRILFALFEYSEQMKIFNLIDLKDFLTVSVHRYFIDEWIQQHLLLILLLISV